MAKLMTYLRFENCKQAMEYYKEVFGATVYSTIPVEEEQAKSMKLEIKGSLEETTMHGAFGILGNTILCSDAFGQEVNYTDTNQLLLDFNSEDESQMKDLEDLYKKVVEHKDTKITMPLDEQYWGGKMGCFIDKYGISWMLHSQPYSKLDMD